MEDGVRPRNYAMDFLKLLATIIIVFHHFQQVTGAVYPGKVNFYGGSFYWGYMVELFFVLSGFFMFTYAKKIQKGEFYLWNLSAQASGAPAAAGGNRRGGLRGAAVCL